MGLALQGRVFGPSSGLTILVQQLSRLPADLVDHWRVSNPSSVSLILGPELLQLAVSLLWALSTQPVHHPAPGFSHSP